MKARRGYAPAPFVAAIISAATALAMLGGPSTASPQEPADCVKVAEGFGSGPGGIFFERQIEVVYAGGPRLVTLAKSCDGDDMFVDDKLIVTNTTNGRVFEHDYSNGCSGLITNTTHDITSLFRVGRNTLRFQGEDICGAGDSAISDIYIIGVEADSEDEPSCDTPFEPGAGGEEIVGSPDRDVLTGTAGNDVICGLGDQDRISGGGGNDVILGGRGPDSLRGGEGTDLLLGERGDDSLMDFDPPEVDTFSGGRGTDSLSYSGKQAGVVAKIGGIGGEPGEGDAIRNSIEELLGTRFDDRLVGNGKKNKLKGKVGTDRLKGRGGRDKLLGGPNGDILEGGARTDTLKGGRGEDDLFGDGGRDRFFGGDNDDTLFARDGRIDLVLDGGLGTDAAFFDRAERGRLSSIETR